VCGEGNAGERRNLEGRALPVFVVCIIPSRPLLLLACIVMLRGARAGPTTTSELVARKHDCPTARIRHAHQPFPIPYCISLLDRGATLGTYLDIIMAALPQVAASLLTCGARCWQCTLHVISVFHQSQPGLAIHSAPEEESDADVPRPIAHAELRTVYNDTSTSQG
jgi:hypothetical protein